MSHPEGDVPISRASLGSSAHDADVALVKRALARDRAAADELATRLRCIGRILAARNRRANGPLRREDLEDLCQDIAATLWAQLRAYSGLGSLEAWVHGYCDHAFRNATRRRRREARRQQGLDGDGPAVPPQDPGAEDPLQRCLERLSPFERRLLQRKHHDGATLVEVAAEFGANVNTVKSQYLRALQSLRACLGGGEADR